jgi:hypothetical protein
MPQYIAETHAEQYFPAAEFVDLSVNKNFKIPYHEEKRDVPVVFADPGVF